VSGQVDSKLAYRVNKELLAMESANADAPVYLFINSPGGEVTSGFSIFDTAKFIKPGNLHGRYRLAASMGSLIALCATRKTDWLFQIVNF